MSAGREDRITMVERRCRLLLRFYPVAYRAERGEEIIGTLLEATPEGRNWPLRRDIRGIAIGGLRARAVLNRRNTTAANLRVAVLVGIAALLAYDVAGYLGDLVFAAEHGGIDFRRTHPVPFGWPLVVVATLLAVTLVLAWLSRRRVIVLAGALPAAAALAVAWHWRSSGYGFAVTDLAYVADLAYLAALVALAGQERPDRRWLWLIGPIVLERLLLRTGPEAIGVVALFLLLAVAIVSIAWLAIDARPGIAIVTLLLAIWLPLAINNVAMGVFSGVPFLAICAVIAVVAVWLLHRQSAHAGRPTRT
ncbi:MAG TPA: hypothetical protein VNW50_21355 [Streptosporangiaceae bacterium]|nr:hypothetical protein [Streptosporangiaceae bacterium]